MDKNEFSNGEQYFLAPGERVEVTAEELASQRRTPQLVKELVESLYRDKVDLKHFIQAYQLIQDNHITVKGARRVPSDTGRQLIIKLYDTVEPYRSLLLETNDHGPYPAREVYDLRCAMVDIIRMYDEYCSAIRDMIVPNMSQQVPASAAPVVPPTATPTEIAPPTTTSSVPATANATSDEEGIPIESVADEALDEAEGFAPVEQATDLSRMRSFTPVTKYNMSALYQFLVDERVVVGVDEKQFADCINQANIKPLWETTESKNLFKLFVHTLKEYYKETYMQRGRVNPEWFLVCCESIDVTAEYMGKMNFPKKDTRVKFCENLKDRIKP